MAITETYVDPAGNDPSGAGTVGDPYLDLQHALDTMSQDAVNGDRINIKAGTDEVLGAALTLATYGTPAIEVPLIFQGYTSAAGDGGIGGISGAGSYSLFAASYNYINLNDLHVHNAGAANIVNVGSYCMVYNCEINNSTGSGYYGGVYSSISFSYIHDISSYAVLMDNGIVYGCSIEYGTKTPTHGVYTASDATITNTTIKCQGAMIGIEFIAAGNEVTNNSIWSNSGTGTGIYLGFSVGSSAINNIVEGFSGAGGIGIWSGARTRHCHVLSNSCYNNTTNYGGVPAHILLNINNDTHSSSAFTDPANGDFSLNGTVADVTGDALPATFPSGATTSLADKGASQAGPGAGGGGGRRPRIRAHGV